MRPCDHVGRREPGAAAQARRHSVADFAPISSGFIFCEFFSNLGATGCRRGRTPERPLRQPSKVWRSSQAFLVSAPRRPNQHSRLPLLETRVNPGLTHVAVALHMLQRVQSVGNLGLRGVCVAFDRGQRRRGRALFMI
jgi:hypothetical protein